MTEIISITDVEPLDGFWIRASFSDDAVKEIDLSELIGRGNVFAPIRDRREVQSSSCQRGDPHDRVARRSGSGPRGALRPL
jgi:hypothetical protein